MEPTIIAACITGGCAIIATIIGGIIAICQSKKRKKEKQKIDVHINLKSQTEIPIPPPTKHPVFLNPDDYDIDEEDYFVTLGGLLQQSRNPKDVSIKKLK